MLMLHSDLHKELSQIDSVHSFDIKEVVEQLEELLTKLNHEKGLDEGRQRLLEMATTIEHFPQDIVSSQRIGNGSLLSISYHLNSVDSSKTVVKVFTFDNMKG